MKKIILVFWLLVALVGCASKPDEKTDRLSVLFVGQNPDKSVGYRFANDDVVNEINQTRAIAYMEFLQKHFNATQVFAENYKPAMSDAYDVTIFDALPPELSGKDIVDGKRIVPNRYVDGWASMRWLPEDFDRPTIFIGSVLGIMKNGLKTKFAHNCHCLTDFAYNFDMNHPIFNGPHKVIPTLEDTPYPKDVYSYYSGRDLPESAPMWRVQVAEKHRHYPSGWLIMNGMDDSPGTEMISGGTSLKSQNDVAISRQGSLLHWGFKASPDLLTDEAKLVFVNAIHYIKQFEGAKRLPLSYQSHARTLGLDAPYRISAEGWAVANADYWRGVKYYQALGRKVKSGKATEAEKQTYQWIKPRPLDRSMYRENVSAPIIEKLGDDWDAYLAYFEENYDYMYPDLTTDPHWDFVVDEDAKSIGIANNNPLLLERAIELLESGKQQALAKRLLARYTDQSFSTPSQWREWYQANRDKMLFTETGGFKFVIDNL